LMLMVLGKFSKTLSVPLRVYDNNKIVYYLRHKKAKDK